MSQYSVHEGVPNMPPLPPNYSVIRRSVKNYERPTWKPPKPGEGTRGYPSIEASTPTITIESSGNKQRSKTNTGSRRSLKTDMSSLARKNMRRKNRRKTVKAKPAGSNPQGTRVVARTISASLRKRKKRKSKKRRYKKRKSKKYTKKRNKK